MCGAAQVREYVGDDGNLNSTEIYYDYKFKVVKLNYGHKMLKVGVQIGSK